MPCYPTPQFFPLAGLTMARAYYCFPGFLPSMCRSCPHFLETSQPLGSHHSTCFASLVKPSLSWPSPSCPWAPLGLHLDYTPQVISSTPRGPCVSGSQVAPGSATQYPQGPSTGLTLRIHTICATESENYVMFSGYLLPQFLTVSFSSLFL